MSFLKDRQKGLGGTDIAAILGINPYKTAYEVYLEKTSPVPLESTPTLPMRMGTHLEDGIVAAYEEATGAFTMKCSQVTHKDYPYLCGHPDRLIEDIRKGLEIKNVGIRNENHWGPSGSLSIPKHYYLQIAHYMYVTDYPEWDVAALIGGNDLRIYTFQRNDAIDKLIEKEGRKFWEDYVQKRQAPPFTYKNGTEKFLQHYYSTVEEKEISLPNSLLVCKEAYLEAKRVIKENEAVAAKNKAEILASLENNAKGVFSDGSTILRKEINVKEYRVEAKKYIRFEYKNFSTREEF